MSANKIKTTRTRDSRPTAMILRVTLLQTGDQILSHVSASLLMMHNYRSSQAKSQSIAVLLFVQDTVDGEEEKRTNALFSDLSFPFPEFKVGHVAFDGTNY